MSQMGKLYEEAAIISQAPAAQVSPTAWVVADEAAQLHLLQLTGQSHASSQLTCQQLPAPEGLCLPRASVLCFRPGPPGAEAGEGPVAAASVGVRGFSAGHALASTAGCNVVQAHESTVRTWTQ